MAEKSIQFSINDGTAFFSDEVSVTNNPVKFIIDFKNTTPRVDIRASEQGSIPLVVVHQPIIMDPYLAKSFHAILGEHIGKYEEQFGAIGEPEQLAKAKERAHEVSNAPAKPGYFG